VQHLAESPLCNLAAESEPEAPSAAPLLPAKQDLLCLQFAFLSVL